MVIALHVMMEEKKRKRLNLSLSRKKSRTNVDDEPTSPSPGRKTRGTAVSTSNSKPKMSIFQMLRNPPAPATNSVCCPVCQANVIKYAINKHLDSGCTSHVLLAGKSTRQSETSDDNSATAEEKSACSGIGLENEKDVCISNQKTRITCLVIDDDDEDLITDDNTSEQNTTHNCISKNTILIDDENRKITEKTSTKRTEQSSGKIHSTSSISQTKQTEEYCSTNHGAENIYESANNIIKTNYSRKNNHKVTEPCGIVTTDIFGENQENCTKHSVDNTNGASENETTSNVSANIAENTDTAQQQDPYYLSNFKLVLETIMTNDEDRNLFNDDDNVVLKKFSELAVDAQTLYVRLFQRKFGWFRCSKLDYPKISDNLAPILKDLVSEGFLEDESQLKELRQVLKLLSAPDIKILAKSLNVIPKSSTQKGQTKEVLTEALIKHGGTQRSLFGSSSALLLKRANQMLGFCVHVSKEPRSVFARALLLFTMNVLPDDEDNRSYGQTQQLSTIFLVNIGKLTYPSYTISRNLSVFPSREHLISYVAAYQEKHDMFTALELSGDVEAAYSYYPNAAERFNKILVALKQKHGTKKGRRKVPYSATLPSHLRCFSAEWVYTRMCYLGVEVLQKMRRYHDAVNQLELLLKQQVYCTDCRGKWWDRLALNLQQHLKQPDKSLVCIKQALEDSNVRFGHRLALVQRAKKILASPSFKKRKEPLPCQIDDGLLVEPRPCNTVTITGKRSAELGVFICPEVSRSGQVLPDTVTYCNVEEYVLSHYRRQGYDEGIHGETGTFLTLYGLLFCEVIFSGGITDVFRVPYQSCPLDLNSDSFYDQRQDMIDSLLKEIRDASVETLQDMVDSAWTVHEGQSCAGVNWERFSGVDQAKQIVACFGGRLLSGIFEHFAKDMRHRHSGMPDLLVWNTSTLEYRIVEVKGPGDRLSTKQQIWLDDLSSLGATVEVCYVTAVGSKQLQTTTTS